MTLPNLGTIEGIRALLMPIGKLIDVTKDQNLITLLRDSLSSRGVNLRRVTGQVKLACDPLKTCEERYVAELAGGRVAIIIGDPKTKTRSNWAEMQRMQFDVAVVIDGTDRTLANAVGIQDAYSSMMRGLAQTLAPLQPRP